jgi:cell division protein FtsB
LWYSCLEEINQKQSELGAARINIEKLRQREHFMVAEIELLKVQKITFQLQKKDHVYFPFLMVYLAIIVG